MTVQSAIPASSSVRARFGDDVRVFSRIVVVGVAVGMLSVGVLSRLAMFVLARTNPDTAGMKTDDGFTIDQFTLSGSLNLLVVGAVLGALSGVLYAALAPLAIGPAWFRRASLCVGAGVVAATQVVHADGIDFVALGPLLLAVGLFVLIPVLHVLALDLLSRRVSHDGLRGIGWTVLGCLCAVPFVALVVPLLLGRLVWLAAPAGSAMGVFLRARLWPWVARGVLTVLFGMAVTDIVQDVATLA